MLNGFIKNGRASATEAKIHDLGTVVGRETDSVGNTRHCSAPTRRQDFDRHDRGTEGNTCHTFAIISRLGHRPRYMGTVTMVVVGLSSVMNKIVTFYKSGLGQIFNLMETTVFRVGVGNSGIDDSINRKRFDY